MVHTLQDEINILVSYRENMDRVLFFLIGPYQEKVNTQRIASDTAQATVEKKRYALFTFRSAMFVEKSKKVFYRIVHQQVIEKCKEMACHNFLRRNLKDQKGSQTLVGCWENNCDCGTAVLLRQKQLHKNCSFLIS